MLWQRNCVSVHAFVFICSAFLWVMLFVHLFSVDNYRQSLLLRLEKQNVSMRITMHLFAAATKTAMHCSLNAYEQKCARKICDECCVRPPRATGRFLANYSSSECLISCTIFSDYCLAKRLTTIICCILLDEQTNGQKYHRPQ